VPNGCTDNSVEVCNELAAEYETIKVKPSEQAGWGRAVKHGLQSAEGDLLCYSNLARTTAEELTLILLYAVAFPDTVVKANRKIRESLIRRLGSLIYNLQCRMLFDLAYWDINGTPKVFPRSFAPLLSLTRDDDLIDLEFNAICRREEYRMLEVPIFSTSRRSGKSTTNYGTAVRLYWGAYKMWRQWK
jgi:glycosyltransferase involved in cell wall biosynthesis